VETRVTEADYDSFGTTKGGGVNSFWYIGWDKSKPYYVRPDWLANWRDPEIPAVCRAQTFKAESSGTLTSVDLKLNWTGSKGTDCGSPLYIQIWNTYKRFVEKTKYDRKKSKMVKVFIRYANIPLKANATAAQIKRGFYCSEVNSRIKTRVKGQSMKELGRELSERMKAICEMVTENSRVCDVGCDHGLVAAYLLVTGKASFVIASDLREKPLQKAVLLKEELGLTDTLSIRLADGLSAVKPGEVDTVIIAGMGGKLIRDILAE
jgi:hypothetical protein